MFSVLLICLTFSFEKANSGSTQNFSVRLNNSMNNNLKEGRLEIYYSGRWGTVCNNGFTDVDARVACASLGFAYIGAYISDGHGAGTDPVWLNDVKCVGNETGLERCVHEGWGAHTGHDHSLDVSIRCDCGSRYFYGLSGKISSPNFPLRYANNLDCYNYIEVASAETIFITFLAFNTELSPDWVLVTCESGSDFRSPSYSGFELPPVLMISSCYRVKVYFHSDASVTYTGFSLMYNITTDCGKRYFYGLSGKISSPNFPMSYANKLDCYNYITVTSGHTVIITFLTLSTESAFDWVMIMCESGNAFRSPRYSGFQIPAVLTISACSLVNVYFHTNYYSTYYGFSLTYNITSDCINRNFSGSTGRISSPNFPMAYNNILDCSSYIAVPSGQTVIITFLAFNFESCCGWVTITCASGNAFTSPRYSGSQIPAVLTISSCNLVKVSFHTDGSSTNTGFNLTYDITLEIVIGGITTEPSNAFPRSDKNNPMIFNCTTATKYLPWWTINDKSSRNYTVTNSTCGVITSAPHSSWFKTESLGPGSCNLIVVAPANNLHLLTGSVVCTDSTLSSARAIMVPINLELSLTTSMNSSTIVTDIIRDEEIRISCNPSFIDQTSSPSLVFTYFLYSGGPFVRMRILRTYWTSQGKVISSNDASRTSSFVLVKAPKGGVIPRYTCNIVCYFFSSISDIRDNSTFELSFSTDPIEVEVLYKTYQNLKLLVLTLGALLGVAVLTITIIMAIPLGRKCLLLKRNTAADVGHGCSGTEHELRQKEGEDNVYETEFGNATDVDDSVYDNLEASHRRRPAEQEVYQELQIKK